MIDPHLKRIVILGPESTGKSVLSKQLAEHYKTVAVPEYAREYIEQLERPYVESDLIEIARGQIKLESQLTGSANRFLFCDTNLIVIRIWSDFKYGSTDPWILESLASRRYDFYLLTDIDLPWKNDPQREHPNQRKELFELYKNYLTGNEQPFGLVSGNGPERLVNAIEFIDRIQEGPS